MRLRHLVLICSFGFTTALHAEMREWTSADSPEKKITGELRSVEGNMVVLKLEGGRIVKFEISKLSEADQVFARTGEDPNSKPVQLGPESPPEEVISSFTYGEDPDEVYVRLKNQSGLRGGVNEILRGRTGLNDMYYIEPDGIRYGLFFDFGENADGLLEVSLQSRGFSEEEFSTELNKTWKNIYDRLEKQIGEPTLRGAFPAKETLSNGLSMSTAIWKTGKGELYLGIGKSEGAYSCVIRIREKGFLAQ